MNAWLRAFVVVAAPTLVLACVGGAGDLGQVGSAGTGESQGSQGAGQDPKTASTGASEDTSETAPPPSSTATTTPTPTPSATGTGTTARPECASYATVYCKCLGTAAAKDCVAGQTAQCNSYYSQCTYAKYATCVTSRNCSTGWLDACSKEKC